MRNGDALGMLVCVMLVALPLGLLIGAVILRAAVSFANKCIPDESRRRYDEDDEWAEEDRRRSRGKKAIPEPEVGKAMGIVFVNGLIGFLISIPINMALGLGAINAGNQGDPALALVATAIQFPIGFLVNAGVLAGMLPTTFGRACLVVVFEYLIVIVICVVIAVPFIILGLAVGR